MTALRYPLTRTVEQVDVYHGRTVPDPYRWLEDPDSPDSRAWIAAQNALTHEWLGGVAGRDELRARLTKLWDHPRAGAPWRRGEVWFQLRNTGLQNQDVLWTMATADAEGQVLLDPNALSEDGTVALTGLSATNDGRLLAYATSASGSDWLTWRVRDVASGEDLGDIVSWSKFSGAAWTPDGAGFFYAAYDEPEEGSAYEATNRDQRLWYHRLGTSQSDDLLVYARPDQPEWGFWPEVSDDGRWLVLHVSHGTERRNRLYYVDLAGWTPLDGPPADDQVVRLLDDFDAAYAFVGNDDTVFYLQTDLQAPRERIVAVDVTRPQRDDWRELVAEGDDTLENARVVGDRIFGVYLHHATHRVRRFRLNGSGDGEVALPGLGSVISLSGRRQDDALYGTFVSFTRPEEVFRHPIGGEETTRFWAPEVDFDADALRTDQVFVTSRDGTRLPMFVVHRADVSPPPDTAACQFGAEQPALLYGYGGFNIPVTPAFKPEWLVWVERGGILAVPNLRGGGEYGQRWHDSGRLANKQNVFDDAVAAAEWLIDHRWTRPERLAISGRSNGGLLAGACLTQRPDLFGAAVPEVGVLDMLRFHTFTIGWGWASDYGTSDDPEQFETLLAYSPLHNLRDGASYPATLVTTGDHDDRVVPGLSFKFAAALQHAQGGEAPILLRVETQGGHGAGKPTAMLIAERADVLAFLERVLKG